MKKEATVIRLVSPIERFLYAKVQKADWDFKTEIHLKKLQTSRSVKVVGEAQKDWDYAHHKSSFWYRSAEYWAKKAGIKNAREQLAINYF